ncbi:hypothetical protein CJ030_MR0G008649 [Morella rubra]|uniref:Uncharacterized protein n=1 Tax=Morella rubra TaxID=262757 RepID=A0A6A1UHU8_9ROSI|nr:hypothetical protein CJ030_MR0G008649 [Morella rubra]
MEWRLGPIGPRSAHGQACLDGGPGAMPPGKVFDPFYLETFSLFVSLPSPQSTDGLRDEVFERFGLEFMTHNLALESPEMTVDVEDAIAKELREEVAEVRAFDVVREVGMEEVVNVGGIGGEDAMGEAKKVAKFDSG